MRHEAKFTPAGRCKKTGSGVAVVRGANESIESLLGRFKKEVINHGVIEKYKDSLVFVKPSVKARQKKSKRKHNAQNAHSKEY